MECFGQHSNACRCAICGYSKACRTIGAFDKSVYRSNMRYAQLKLTVDNADMKGLAKTGPNAPPPEINRF